MSDKRIKFDGEMRLNERGQPKEIDMDMPSLKTAATIKLSPTTGAVKSVKVRPYRKVAR